MKIHHIVVLFWCSLLVLPACRSTETAVSPASPTATPADATPVPEAATAVPPTPAFIKGVDVSFLPQVETCGGVFFDEGMPTDALQIFARHGLNWARLRVWVNPPDGANSLDQVLIMAKRIKALGMNLLIDFHSRDTQRARHRYFLLGAGLHFDSRLWLFLGKSRPI
jgi:hypothetical protein